MDPNEKELKTTFRPSPEVQVEYNYRVKKKYNVPFRRNTTMPLTSVLLSDVQ